MQEVSYNLCKLFSVPELRLSAHKSLVEKWIKVPLDVMQTVLNSGTQGELSLVPGTDD